MEKTKKINRSQEEQMRYLSQSIRLQEAIHPRLARVTILSLSLSVAAFIGWASITNINEIARAPGEIVPQGFQQVVQHFDGGIVTEILVNEGQLVNKGDLLITLDGAGAQEDLDRASGQQMGILAQKERLLAFVEDRKPDFSRTPDVTKQQAVEQMKIFNSMVEAREQEKHVIKDQVIQKQQSIDILRSKQATVEQNLALTRDKYRRYQELDLRGSLPHLDFMEAEKELNSLTGELDQTRRQIAQAQSELREYEGRLQSLVARYRDEAYQQLDALESSLLQNNEVISKHQSRVNRLEVRAPVKGVVKGLTVNTIGGVVQAGQSLMEIVPLDKALVVETRIPPQYIGNLKPGQAVQVKVSAYDFSRYGSVRGKLESISATTFTDEKGERFYRGRVILDQNYVGQTSGANFVAPGMTVMADVITGRKTILEYLLKPIHRSLLTAFSER